VRVRCIASALAGTVNSPMTLMLTPGDGFRAN
jgi:hypothetical protein